MIFTAHLTELGDVDLHVAYEFIPPTAASYDDPGDPGWLSVTQVHYYVTNVTDLFKDYLENSEEFYNAVQKGEANESCRRA